jgi:hypothetical protein
MTQTRLLKTAGVITAFAAIILAGMMNNSRRVRARDDDGGDEREESRIRRGFEIAPVHLNLEGRNPALVGLGRYIVNAVGDVFRRWARFWPGRLSSPPLLPQFDAGQDWAA